MCGVWVKSVGPEEKEVEGPALGERKGEKPHNHSFLLLLFLLLAMLITELLVGPPPFPRFI